MKKHYKIPQIKLRYISINELLLANATDASAGTFNDDWIIPTDSKTDGF